MILRQALTQLAFLAVIVAGLWLLASYGWRAPLGVFLVLWGNNQLYSYRLRQLARLANRI